MRAPLERLVLFLLEVPPRPAAPEGEGLQVFRASPGFFRYRLLSWVVSRLWAAAGLVVGVLLVGRFEDYIPGVGEYLVYLEWLAVASFLALLPLSYLMVRLDYRYRWYMVTDRSLRIREKLWTVEERTMTFSNIQNISVRQGPLQRFFGIADLEVRSAGGGTQAGDTGGASHGKQLHVGYFRGVGNANEIRDLILGHLRRLRAAGLGDPDGRASREEASEGAAELEAAQRLLEEVRGLAAVVVPPE